LFTSAPATAAIASRPGHPTARLLATLSIRHPPGGALSNIERQTELVLEQMKLCLETGGSCLENVLKCNVCCTSVEKLSAVNAITSRFCSKDPSARIFGCVPAWPGPFDIEIDCVATF
jgi:enamine deaminase RidA (YjgF/YER057c/UK114 family)